MLNISKIEFISESGPVEISQIEFISERSMIFNAFKTEEGDYAQANFVAVTASRFRFVDEDDLDIPWEILKKYGAFSFNGDKIKIASLDNLDSAEKFSDIASNAMMWARNRN